MFLGRTGRRELILRVVRHRTKAAPLQAPGAGWFERHRSAKPFEDEDDDEDDSDFSRSTISPRMGSRWAVISRRTLLLQARIRNYSARTGRRPGCIPALPMHHMKTSSFQLENSPEFLKLIPASNGVKKVGPKEGRTIQVGGVRLTWKATGEDTGYTNGIYEMDLPPGKGIPLHSHPYAEVFYVVSGHTDFLRVGENGQEEWVRCGAGDTLIAPANALHAFHNRTDKPTRFLSSSGYYHQLTLDTAGQMVDVNAPLPPEEELAVEEAEQYLQTLKNAMTFQMYFPQSNASSGFEALREIKKRNEHTNSSTLV